MVAENAPERLPLSDLVSVERKGAFLTVNFPSESIHVVLVENIQSEAILRDSEEAPEGFFENEPKKITLSKSGDGPYLLISPDVEAASLEEPFKMSEDSEAKYLARLEIDGMLFLLQYLDGQSSRHSHNDLELLAPLDANKPCFGKNSSVFSVTQPTWIQPGVIHEAFSLDEPTLALIVQPFGVDHIPDPAGKSEIGQMRADSRLLV